LRDRGWIEGKNLLIERRYAEGHSERYHNLAIELVEPVWSMSSCPREASVASGSTGCDEDNSNRHVASSEIPSRPASSRAMRGLKGTSRASWTLPSRGRWQAVGAPEGSCTYCFAHRGRVGPNRRAVHGIEAD
jgi:hypothetical protein